MVNGRIAARDRFVGVNIGVTFKNHSIANV